MVTTPEIEELEYGTAQLEEAVAACRAAPEERTRERVPPDYWAMKQYDLGEVLVGLGKREEGTVRLEEAIAAYRGALEAFERLGYSVKGARTLGGLANALALLAKRQKNAAIMEEALSCMRRADDIYQTGSEEWLVAQHRITEMQAELVELQHGS